MEEEEEVEIVIVGGGICGLALAVGLLRQGVKSLVLEKSETLRSDGAGVGIYPNGWRALDELGVGSKLRQKKNNNYYCYSRIVDVDLQSGKQRTIPILSGSEARAVTRSDLIKALAEELPSDGIRYGCQVISVMMTTTTATATGTCYMQYLSNNSSDGTTIKGSIKAKLVVGCDGANSIFDRYLNLNPKKLFSLSAVRGLTNYPNGHGFSSDVVRFKRGTTMFGIAPINDNLVFWFQVQKTTPNPNPNPNDLELIKQFALEAIIQGFPEECKETVNKCDLASLSLSRLRYRPPWDLLFLHKFVRSKGNNYLTLAGDAMHLIGPFLGQGASAAMEDAVVLARCLNTHFVHHIKSVEEALDDYLKERRMRLFRLSTQTYLIGKLLEASSSPDASISCIFNIIKRFILGVFMMTFFRDPMDHTRYDCGRL